MPTVKVAKCLQYWMPESRGYSTEFREGTRGSMTRIAGDFREESTMRSRRSGVTTAGHSGNGDAAAVDAARFAIWIS